MSRLLIVLVCMAAGCVHNVSPVRDDDGRLLKVRSISEYTYVSVSKDGVEIVDTKSGPGLTMETLEFLKEMVSSTAEKVETRWNFNEDDDD